MSGFKEGKGRRAGFGAGLTYKTPYYCWYAFALKNGDVESHPADEGQAGKDSHKGPKDHWDVPQGTSGVVRGRVRPVPEEMRQEGRTFWEYGRWEVRVEVFVEVEV